MSWHRDPEPSVHIPIITDYGNMQVIEEEVLHMKVGEVWWADTEGNPTWIDTAGNYQ